MGVYYPPHFILYRWLEIETAYVTILLGHPLLGAVGVYWWARRLEKDLERPARGTRVVHDALSELLGLGRRGDPEQDGLTGRQDREGLLHDRRGGALPPDEAFHRPVAEHDRLVARLRRGRALGPHHPGVDEGLASRSQLGHPGRQVLADHSIARSVRMGRPFMAAQVTAGVKGMSA